MCLNIFDFNVFSVYLMYILFDTAYKFTKLYIYIYLFIFYYFVNVKREV